MAQNKTNAKRRNGDVVPDNILTFKVTEPCELMEFLIEKLHDLKRTKIKSFLAHNQVAVNGRPTTQYNTELNFGDMVDVNTTREFQVLHNRRVKIVYEDDDIIVINKGYGLLSVGTERKGKKVKSEETAYNIVKEYVKWQDPRNKIFVVHRLDQQTSGLMMLARNPEAQEGMQHNWNNMVISRKYVCLVEGYMEKDEGEVRSYLAENKQFEVYSTKNPEEGKLAITRYKVLGRKNGYSLVEVSLDTGRKNQIRVHMKDLGHPIAGDRKYGAKPSPIKRLCLHAQTLKFAHPITRRLMDFSTPIPSNFLKIVQPKKADVAQPEKPQPKAQITKDETDIED